MPVTKKEAAELLGVSERAIARYVERGRLHVTYQNRSIGGQLALYDEEELRQLKAEMANPLKREAAQSDTLTVRDGKVSGGQLELFAALMAEALAAQEASQHASVPIADKLTLSLAEAAALSGLSRGNLRAAIADGRLKASIIGRGWRVKRADLDTFVKKL